MPQTKDKRYHKTIRGVKERNELVVKWRYLPRWVIGRWPNHPAIETLGWDDAEAVGMLGLLRAAELWDAKKDVRFNTYAVQSIFRRIVHEAKTRGHLIHLPEYRWGKGDRPASRSKPQDERDFFFGVDPQARESRAAVDDREEVEVALARLTPREREVIEARFWKYQTLQEIGRSIGMTKEAVRLIEKRAIEKMRAKLGG